MKFAFFASLIAAGCTSHVFAGDFITAESDSNSYHYVSSYNIKMDASTEGVWKELVILKSCMYEFEMSNHSGDLGQAQP